MMDAKRILVAAEREREKLRLIMRSLRRIEQRLGRPGQERPGDVDAARGLGHMMGQTLQVLAVGDEVKRRIVETIEREEIERENATTPDEPKTTAA